MAIADGAGNRFAGKRLSRLTRLMEIAEQAILSIALIAFFLANSQALNPANLLVVASDALAVFFVFFRRRTNEVSRSPLDWTLAVTGTLGGMLMRPGGAPLVPPAVAAVLILDGLIIQIVAKLSLNSRFGIAPANRGIQDRWVYRLVRHPMYLGYLLMHTGYVLNNPTAANIALGLATWTLQFGRIIREEEFLLSDPAYRAYAQRVRYRMVPMLF